MSVYKNLKIVKMSWFDRICAILFGRKRKIQEEDRIYYFSHWRDVYYLLWEKNV